MLNRRAAIGALIWFACAGAAMADRWPACQAGDEEACVQGAIAAQAADDLVLMLRFVRKGCDLGNVFSCGDLGMIWLIGLGQTADPARAMPLLIDACTKGYGRACTNLGWASYTGTGRPVDLAGAAGFYQRGCDGGSAPGCRNLGLMYEAGDGVVRDASRALRLFDKACALGLPDAC